MIDVHQHLAIAVKLTYAALCTQHSAAFAPILLIYQKCDKPKL